MISITTIKGQKIIEKRKIGNNSSPFRKIKINDLYIDGMAVHIEIVSYSAKPVYAEFRINNEGKIKILKNHDLAMNIKDIYQIFEKKKRIKSTKIVSRDSSYALLSFEKDFQPIYQRFGIVI